MKSVLLSPPEINIHIVFYIQIPPVQSLSCLKWNVSTVNSHRTLNKEQIIEGFKIKDFLYRFRLWIKEIQHMTSWLITHFSHMKTCFCYIIRKMSHSYLKLRTNKSPIMTCVAVQRVNNRSNKSHSLKVLSDFTPLSSFGGFSVESSGSRCSKSHPLFFRVKALNYAGCKWEDWKEELAWWARGPMWGSTELVAAQRRSRLQAAQMKRKKHDARMLMCQLSWREDE